MQADPIKPTLKAPGTKRLKLQHDELLSNFAFKINLRRYNVADIAADAVSVAPAGRSVLVGRCRLTLSNPR